MREYVDAYKDQLALKLKQGEVDEEGLKKLARYYQRFVEAAKRLGFHTY